MDPRGAQDHPRWAQERLKIAEDEPTIAEDGQTSVSHRGRWPIRTLDPYFAGPNATEDGLDVRWTRILRVRTRRKSRKYRILRGGSDPGVCGVWSREPKIGPRWTQEGLKITQDGPKKGSRSPKMSPRSPKMAKHRSHIAEDGLYVRWTRILRVRTRRKMAWTYVGPVFCGSERDGRAERIVFCEVEAIRAYVEF